MSVVIYLLSFCILFIWILSPFLLMSLARGLLILSTLSENPLLVLQVTFWGLSGVLFSPPECFQSEAVWIFVCRKRGYGGPALFFNFCCLSSSLLMGADWNLKSYNFSSERTHPFFHDTLQLTLCSGIMLILTTCPHLMWPVL